MNIGSDSDEDRIDDKSCIDQRHQKYSSYITHFLKNSKLIFLPIIKTNKDLDVITSIVNFILLPIEIIIRTVACIIDSNLDM